jgi:hypothetical protein
MWSYVVVKIEETAMTKECSNSLQADTFLLIFNFVEDAGEHFLLVKTKIVIIAASLFCLLASEDLLVVV